MARHIEHCFGKRKFWLDADHSNPDGKPWSEVDTRRDNPIEQLGGEVGRLAKAMGRQGARDLIEALSVELPAKDAAWAAALFSARAQQLLEEDDT